jgi:hypothetical protein
MRRIAVAIAALLLAAGTTPVLAGGGVPKLANVDAGPHQVELFNDSPSLVTGTNTLTIESRTVTAEHAVHLVLDGPNGERIPVPLTELLVLEGPGGGHGGGEDSHAASPSDDHAAAAEGDHGTMPADAHGATSSHGTTAAVTPATKDNHGAPSAPVQAKLAPAADSHGASAGVADPHGAPAKDDHGSAAPVPSTAAAHDESKPGVTDAAHGNETEGYMARGSVSVPATGLWIARLVIRDQHGEEVVGETPLVAVEGGPSKLYLSFTGSLIFGSMLFGLVQRHRKSRAPITNEGRD